MFDHLEDVNFGIRDLPYLPLTENYVVCDVETNGLNPDKIWILGWTWPDDFREEFFFEDGKMTEEARIRLQELIDQGVYIVGHNFIAYDAWVLENLGGIVFDYTRVCDTLTLSQLLRPTAPKDEGVKAELRKRGLDTREGGHSLGAWGERLGVPKVTFDKSQFERGLSEEMITYWRGDLATNLAAFRVLTHEYNTYKFSPLCVEIEMRTQYEMAQQTHNGFKLDRDVALAMQTKVTALLDHALSELQSVFPPKRIDLEANVEAPMIEVPVTVEERSVYKTGPKAGTEKVVQRKTGEVTLVMHGGFARRLENNLWDKNADGTYTFYEWQECNPSSPAQVAERLLELGWKPKKLTGKGQPSVSKMAIGDAIDELKTQVPQVQLLAKYGILDDRLSTVKKWLELAEEDGHIHGSVKVVGARTHRMAHFNPNMANIAKVSTKKVDPIGLDLHHLAVIPEGPMQGHIYLSDTEVALTGFDGNFGWECRSCWTVSNKDNVLVGCDASAIQLRALAHYMKDEDYIKEVVEGDVHTRHKEAAGLDDRPTAKTWLYALLLGAGNPKLGVIAGVKDAKSLVLGNKKLAKSEARNFEYRGETLTGVALGFAVRGAISRDLFYTNVPAFKRLKDECKNIAKIGFVVGLDGRKIWVASDHEVMGALLQGFEAVVMKHAIISFTSKMRSEGIPFWMRGTIHDEVEVETTPEHATLVGFTFANCIKEAGEILGSLCPLAGEFKQGKAWSHTH